MAPHDMKFTLKDIVDGLFPTKEQIRKREEQRIALYSILGEIIAKHKDKVPDELDLVNDTRTISRNHK
jgi:nanoRNase/pAp phosphatase (c-di-AMP/oligoRNAs hydrolase)